MSEWEEHKFETRPRDPQGGRREERRAPPRRSLPDGLPDRHRVRPPAPGGRREARAPGRRQGHRRARLPRTEARARPLPGDQEQEDPRHRRRVSLARPRLQPHVRRPRRVFHRGSRDVSAERHLASTGRRHGVSSAGADRSPHRPSGHSLAGRPGGATRDPPVRIHRGGCLRMRRASFRTRPIGHPTVS